MMVPSKQTTPLPLPSRDHEVVASAVTGNPVPAAVSAGGGATEMSPANTMSVLNFEIVVLVASNLPSNNRGIYEAMLECMLADPVESEVEAPEFAMPAAATLAEAAAPADGEPTLGATATGQLSPVQAGDVRGLVPSTASEVAEEVLEESAAETKLTLVATSPSTARVDSSAADVPESSSLRTATPVDETAPATSPSLAALQEHDTPGSVARAASLEIQEIAEGSGVTQPSELEEDDARILNLAASRGRLPWRRVQTLRMRSPQLVTLSSAGCREHATHSTSSFFLLPW